MEQTGYVNPAAKSRIAAADPKNTGETDDPKPETTDDDPNDPK